MKGFFKAFIPAVSLVSVVIFSPSLHAEGKCKDLGRAQCSTDESCTWVKGYTTKTGKKVDAYCRVKSGKKAASGKDSAKAEKDAKADKAKKSEKPKQEKRAVKAGDGSSKTKSKKEEKSNER